MNKKLYDEVNGRKVYLYTIRDGDVSADISEYGARINSLTVGDIDIVLGFNGVKEYLDSKSYAGATVGRVANRIAGGRFVLNGRPYFLDKNDGENHLHGGNLGFDKRIFDVINYTKNSVEMQYISADGEERYPGTLKFTVKFTVKDNSLLIDFTAVSDKDTLWAPTSHSYFNLDGEAEGDCLGNLLKINADGYTPVDGGLIPTGEVRAVKGTPFDFNKLKPVGADFESEQLKATAGYDHNFVLNGGHAAHAEGAKTGIKMDLYTDLPCIQLYTAGMLNPCAGKSRVYGKWAGFCIEPQFCPNAVNLKDFATPTIKANAVNTHFIKYNFSK